MYFIYGSWLGLATIGQVVSVENIAKQGASLSTLAPAAVWACVALISVIGLVKLYLDNKKDQEDLKLLVKSQSDQMQVLVKSTTEAITKSHETSEKTNDVLESINANLANCTRKSNS